MYLYFLLVFSSKAYLAWFPRYDLWTVRMTTDVQTSTAIRSPFDSRSTAIRYDHSTVRFTTVYAYLLWTAVLRHK